MCRKYHAVLFIVITAVSAVFHFPSFAATSEKIPVWEFMGYQKRVKKCKGTIAYDRAFFDNGIHRYLMRPPDFEKLAIIDDENHLYLDTTVSDFVDTHMAGCKPEFPPLHLVGRGVLHELNCKHYQATVKGVDIDAWFTDELRIDPKLLARICRLLELPSGYGLPVSCKLSCKQSCLYTLYRWTDTWRRGHLVETTLDSNQPHVVFQLLKVKQESLPVATFDLPKDYKVEHDEARFFFSDLAGDTSSMDSLFSSSSKKK